MYIFKNALRNIHRAKGRTILIFVLVLIIAISACVSLTIKSSADNAKEESLSNMSISAQINIDRTSMMENAEQNPGEMSEMMKSFGNGLTLEEYEIYAEAESVQNFYYSASLSLNAEEDGIEAYDTSSMAMVGPGQGGGMSNGDFTVTGYSSHDAMTSFIDGITVISEGTMFDVDDTTNSASISQEVALLNDLEVGDNFILENPNNPDDLITVLVSSIFTCESSDSYVNDIYMSYSSVEKIVEDSEDNAVMVTDERSGTEVSSAFSLNEMPTYSLATPDDLAIFEEEIIELGLDSDTYTVTSSDLEAFEETMVPLENLSNFTMIFFVVILLVGAIILIVFNLFTIRERKYEIGVLAAIGMRKSKVVCKFLTEVIVITFIAILIGSLIGIAISQPLSTTLLESQVESVSSSNEEMSNNFGGNFSGGGPGGNPGGNPGRGAVGGFGNDIDYVDSIETNFDFVILLQLMGLGIILSVIASIIGMISILRYDPLKILSERS